MTDDAHTFLTSTTGIPWLDEVMASMPPLMSLEGGVARGRTISICGAAGTGKTMLAMQLLVATTGPKRPGLMLLGEETLAVAVERMNELRTVQELREAQLAHCLMGKASYASAAVDYIDMLSSRNDPDRVLSILRTLKASVVVLDMTPWFGETLSGMRFLDRCRSAVDRATTMVFTSSWRQPVAAPLEDISDLVLVLDAREVVSGVTRVRLSSRKHRFVPTPKGFAQLEVQHDATVHHTPGSQPLVIESRSLVQV